MRVAILLFGLSSVVSAATVLSDAEVERRFRSIVATVDPYHSGMLLGADCGGSLAPRAPNTPSNIKVDKFAIIKRGEPNNNVYPLRAAATITCTNYLNRVHTVNSRLLMFLQKDAFGEWTLKWHAER